MDSYRDRIAYWKGQEKFYDNYLGVISPNGSRHVRVPIPSTWAHGDIQLAPDHKRLAISNYDNSSLVVIDLDSQTIQTLATGMGCHGGTWSPDGKFIVASCDQGGLRLFSIQDGYTTALAQDCHSACALPEWSPDGKWIALSVADFIVETDNGLYLLDTACFEQPAACFTTKRGPLNPESDTIPPSWSPDSKYLVMKNKHIRPNIDQALWLEFINIQMGQVERAVQIEGADPTVFDSLAWSPDGMWVAYNQSNGIYLFPIAGGESLKVPGVEEMVSNLDWITISYPITPNGTYMITEAGHDLNLRAEPSLDVQPLRKLQPGDGVTVLDGPASADGYTWWKLKADDSIEGWAVNIPEWYEPMRP